MYMASIAVGLAILAYPMYLMVVCTMLPDQSSRGESPLCCGSLAQIRYPAPYHGILTPAAPLFFLRFLTPILFN